MFTENYSFMFNEFKKSTMNEFEMTNLGMVLYFLGIEIVQSKSGIFLSQNKYVGEILKGFHMHDFNSANTPLECGFKLCKDHEGKK
uniref:Copia protein n=1 Tax=Cajanus cajan TaxID=3821 RepID=A0A151QX64_CAJCA|nr:Copia protein [Cajanus cajan]